MTFTQPLPILADDDPVLVHVARLAGAVIVDGTPPTIEDCAGLGMDDLKAACYQARDEVFGLQAIQVGAVVNADRDGWADDTVVTLGEEALDLDAVSQPVFGTWVEDASEEPPWSTRVVLLYGYSYDMHLAAAIFCDMWASAVKNQFDFNDGSGNYARSQKYQQIRDTERSQRSKARVQQVDVERSDTVSASAQAGSMSDWFRRMGNG